MSRVRGAIAAAACLAVSTPWALAQETKPPLPAVAANQRVIHGSAVKPGTYPFQVLVNMRNNNGKMFMCGGSLIGDSTWVLTAAHCVYDTDGTVIPPWQFAVSAGSVLYHQGNIISVTEVHAHRDYNAANHDNDYALVRLRTRPRAVPFATIALLDPAAEADFDKDDVPATVIGWGTMENEKTSNRLLEGQVRIVSRKQCNQNYVGYYMRGLEGYLGAVAQSGRDAQQEEKLFFGLRFDDDAKARARQMIANHASPGEVLTFAAGKAGTIITDTMICALGSAPKVASDELVTDACQGDSGGPLFTAGKDGKPTLVGIVSWGTGGRIGCGSPTEPGVYARVAKAVGWVNGIINK
jgi:secreted trypsin-like serine protease